MKGNLHVQFLGEGVAATSPPYPTSGGRPPRSPRPDYMPKKMNRHRITCLIVRRESTKRFTYEWSAPTEQPAFYRQGILYDGEGLGDRTFKLLALVMMASAGVATLLNAAHIIWRDTFGSRRDREHWRRDACLRWTHPSIKPPPGRRCHPGMKPATERRWSGKA